MAERSRTGAVLLVASMSLSEAVAACSGSGRQVIVPVNKPVIVSENGTVSTLTPAPNYEATLEAIASKEGEMSKTPATLPTIVSTEVPIEPPSGVSTSVPTVDASTLERPEPNRHAQDSANGIDANRIANEPLADISPEVYEKVRRSTTMLLIEFDDENGHQVAQCTGVHIGNGLIVSNGHCAVKNATFRIGHPDWKLYNAHVLKSVFDEMNDVGLWQIEDFQNDLEVAPQVATSNLRSGDTVFTLAYSLMNGSNSIQTDRAKFIVEAPNQFNQRVAYFADGLDGTTIPGNSGAFIFTSRGEWVGQVSRSLFKHPEITADLKRQMGLSEINIPNIAYGLSAANVKRILGR